MPNAACHSHDGCASFYDAAAAPQREHAFRRWFERERPDVILTLYHVVHVWLKKLGVRVPDAVGLIQLDWGRITRARPV